MATPATKEKDAAPEAVKQKMMAYYSPFVRINKEKKIVEGIASSEAIDSYGDIVRITAIQDALPDYMQFANLRAMHSNIAAGKIVGTDIDKDQKVFFIKAKVVDKAEWEKVTEEVYKGFSIGGVIEEMKPILVEVEDPDGNTHKVFTGGFEITKIKLIEISLVDRPANPDALIQSYKAANLRKYSTREGEQELEESFLPNVILKPNLTKFVVQKDNKASPSSINSSKKSPFLSLLAPHTMSTITKADFQKTATTVVNALLKKHGISQEVLEEPITLSRGEIVELAREMVSETTDHLAYLAKAEGAEAPDAIEEDAKPVTKKADGGDSEEETPAPAVEVQVDEKEETPPAPEAAPAEKVEATPVKEEAKVEKTEAAPEASKDDALIKAINALTSEVQNLKKSNDTVAKSVKESNSEVVSAVNDLKKAAGASSQSDEEVEEEEAPAVRKDGKKNAFAGDDWGRHV